MNIIVVAVGGALGAICRYGVSLLPFESQFPFATFVVNLLGAFIIGVVIGLAENRELSPHVVLFAKTGFCGGFTTFSTFSAESLALISAGRYFVAGTYITLSFACCIVGVLLGKLCVR